MPAGTDPGRMTPARRWCAPSVGGGLVLLSAALFFGSMLAPAISFEIMMESDRPSAAQNTVPGQISLEPFQANGWRAAGICFETVWMSVTGSTDFTTRQTLTLFLGAQCNVCFGLALIGGCFRRQTILWCAAGFALVAFIAALVVPWVQPKLMPASGEAMAILSETYTPFRLGYYLWTASAAILLVGISFRLRSHFRKSRVPCA